MCELFGYQGATRNLTAPLAEFFSHSTDHPDGWGLATRQHGAVSAEKEFAQASRSSYLLRRLSAGVTTDLALGHIRKATVGIRTRENCHPFTGTDCTGRQWTLIHNGTMFDAPELEPFRATQIGNTDSERVLLCLLDRINRATAEAGRPLTATERFAVIDRAVCSLSANNNKLNLLLFDGQLLFAHSNYEGTLHTCTTPEGTLFSTRPLAAAQEAAGENAVDLTWEPLPFCQLTAFANGRLALTGTDHGNVSVPAPELLAKLKATTVAVAC
ncbi:MAG: class II glutamine amidotransferase [Coriobacteriia bacterium]|nr:class II glutamine amidotransferase [Coriobacteriia bacterium]